MLARRSRELRHDLDGFVSVLAQRLLDQGVPPDDIPGVIEYAIAVKLGVPDQPISATYAMLVSEALRSARLSAERMEHANEPWHNIAEYAHEIHAVRLQANRVEVTDIGRVLLELAGMEAVRWLLHVEAALATGPGDPWRVDRGTLRKLVEHQWASLAPIEDSDNPHSIHRLAWLGLLEPIESDLERHGIEEYRVAEHALPVLREVCEGRDTPMSLLLAALLEDDVRTRLPARGAPPPSQAMIRQTRHVIHEIGNALVPVQEALARVYKEAERAGAGERIASYTATTRERALAKLDEAGWDVVVLDQKLLGPSGPDHGIGLIAEVAARSPGAKAIMVTAYATDESIDRAFDAGIYDFIEKVTPRFGRLVRVKVRNAVEAVRERSIGAMRESETEERIHALWQALAQEADNNKKGRALEELMILIVRSINGFHHVDARLRSEDEEIDIRVRNESVDPFWQAVQSPYILFECKNWSRPVGKNEFVLFQDKLVHRYGMVKLGFFVTTSNFTQGFFNHRQTERKSDVLMVCIDGQGLKRLIESQDRNATLKELCDHAVIAARGGGH